MNQELNAIEVSDNTASLISPAADIESLKRHWQSIQELERSILDKSDIQQIGDKLYVKRSGWRKLASAFNISDRLISQEREQLPDGQFLWRVVTEAYHKGTGRTSIGVGSSASNERKFAHVEHDTLATAMTRSKNRSLSDLIGLGEVSAEEIEGESDEPPRPAAISTELCSCAHGRDQHFKRDSKTCCVACIKTGKDGTVKCSLQLK